MATQPHSTTPDLALALDEFLQDLRLNGRQQGTIKKHELELLRLSRWLAGESLAWDTLTRKQLQQYARLRADRGFSCKSNMFCTLRTFYRWAVEQSYVAMSPAVGFKTPSKPHPQPRALTMAQVKQLLAHLAQRPKDRAKEHRDQVLMLTGLYAGLRARELAELRWSSIDFGADVINIRISKMNHGRSVPLHTALKPVLLAWQQRQGLDGDSPVFSLSGAPIRPNRVGKVASQVRRATGLPLTAHVLRHTFATWALRRSGNLYAVSKALGHQQLQQTEVYVSVAIEDVRPAVATLPDLSQW